MKLLRVVLIVMMLGSISILSLSCADGEDQATAENQVATVQRGDLTIDITAVGNLALSDKEKLTFEMAGTVEEVLVEEGDSVEEGQVLAELDTSERRDQITALQRQLETKKRDLLQAEINLTSAEDALNQATSAENAELATAQTQVNLANAKIALANAQNNYDRAKERYQSNWTIPEWIRDYELKTAQLTVAEINLAEAEEALARVPDDIELDIVNKQKELAIVEGKLEDAQKAVEDAQKELDDMQNSSPAISAPFAGFITRVNVSAGDEVNTGTVAIELADPNKFEAEILVNETDIFQVKVGGNATVQVDAMQTIVLPATVTSIAPEATIQSGVVNYKVKVEPQPLQAVAQERQTARQQISQGIAGVDPSERLKQAVEEGRLTQEQADEMLKRIQEGGLPFQPGENQGQSPFAIGSGQTPATLTENYQLREGLTVTVSIIVDQRSNVLLVPNSAITQGRQTYVNVVLPDGTIEQRAITTGISDWQYTEVTNGLSEGDNVIIPQNTASSSTTSQQGQQFRMPGVGGFGR